MSEEILNAMSERNLQAIRNLEIAKFFNCQSVVNFRLAVNSSWAEIQTTSGFRFTSYLPKPFKLARIDEFIKFAPFIMDIIEMHKLPGEFDHFYTYNKFAANCVHVQTCKFCCKLANLKIVQIPIHIYYLIIGLFNTLHVSSIVSIYCTCCIYCTYYMYILFLCIITTCNIIFINFIQPMKLIQCKYTCKYVLILCLLAT